MNIFILHNRSQQIMCKIEKTKYYYNEIITYEKLKYLKMIVTGSKHREAAVTKQFLLKTLITFNVN